MSAQEALAPRIVVIDVPETKLHEVVAFWSAALGATPRWPDDERDPFVRLDGARSVLEVAIQRTHGVPRYHVDLPATDVQRSADRLVQAGARSEQRQAERWVLRDPAGLRFCLVDDGLHAASVGAREAGRVHLDGLFVDAPSPQVDTEVAFWASVFGAEVAATSRPETYTALPGVRGPGGDLLVEVQRLRDGAARFHVDLSTDDVDGEAQRMEELGATRVGEVETWTTFADPAGNLFCVVPA